MADYTITQIRQYIRDVVAEAKRTAHVDTGFLKRSIKGAWVAKKNRVEFREIFYGAYNDNSQLIRIAQKQMPKDLDWVVIFEDEEGRETSVEATTRTGRKVSTKTVSGKNVSTDKIKQLIKTIQRQANAKKKDSTTEGGGERDKETS